MKKSLVSVFCLFLFILSSLYAQTAKEPKVITINSVRIMEVFKKENKAQYGTKPDKSDKKKDVNSSEDKTEQEKKSETDEKPPAATKADAAAIGTDTAAGPVWQNNEDSQNTAQQGNTGVLPPP